MAQAHTAEGHAQAFRSHNRTDNWWIGPLLTFLGLSAFGVYATRAAFQGAHYFHGSYLSPFFSNSSSEACAIAASSGGGGKQR